MSKQKELFGEPEERKGYKKTEIGGIPEDWGIKLLGEILFILKDGTHLPPQRVSTGPLLLSVQNMINGKFMLTENDTHIPWNFYNQMHKNWTIIPGDVLLAIVGATIGKSCIVPNNFPPFTLQRSVAIMRGKDDILNTKYLFYYVFSHFFQKQLLSRANQTAQAGVYLGEIKKIKIPLPPLPEQKKIAQILSTWDKAIEKTEKLIEAKTKLKKGLMQRLLTGKTRFKEFVKSEKMKRTSIGNISEDWEVVNFGYVVSLSQYGLSSASKENATIPMLGMKNIHQGSLDTSDLAYINLEKDEFEKFKLEQNDLLFNRTNSYDLVGKTTLFDLSKDYVFASYLIRFKLKKEIASPRYINFFFNSEKTQKKLKTLATKGVSQVNINPTTLQKNLWLPLPPLSEQQKIAEVFRSCDQEIELLIQKLEKLKQQKKGLMQKLLTGQIRVQLSEP